MRFEHGQDEVVHGFKLDRLFCVGCHSDCAVARRRDAHVSHHRASGNAFQGARTNAISERCVKSVRVSTPYSSATKLRCVE